MGASDLTAELVPVSQSLQQVSKIGLDTLDLLQKGQPMTASAQQQDLTAVTAAEKPQAVLLLMVAPSVEMLVKAVKVQ